MVGVARDTRSRYVWQKDERFVYVPVPTTKTRYFLVQTRSDSPGTMSIVRGLASSIDPALRTSVRRIEDSLATQTAPFRALAWLSGAVGFLALVLASLGLYGVTSFLVARRTHEIGIRMALGARGSDVVRMFLRNGLRIDLGRGAPGDRRRCSAIALTRIRARRSQRARPVRFRDSFTVPVFGGRGDNSRCHTARNKSRPDGGAQVRMNAFRVLTYLFFVLWAQSPKTKEHK